MFSGGNEITSSFVSLTQIKQPLISLPPKLYRATQAAIPGSEDREKTESEDEDANDSTSVSSVFDDGSVSSCIINE